MAMALVVVMNVAGVVPLSCANGILAGLWAGSMFLATMSMGVRVDAMVDDWIGVLERRTNGVVPDIGVRADVDASLCLTMMAVVDVSITLSSLLRDFLSFC